MSRQVYLLGLGLALVALAFLLTDDLVSGTPGITERNVKRIRPGTTAGEVEALLGVLPREGVCVVGPGSYPWWEVKGIMTNHEDPRRLRQFVAYVRRRTDPIRYIAPYDMGFYCRGLTSEKGLEVAFYGTAGGTAIVHFGKGGCVRRAQWLPEETLQRGSESPELPLDRLRAWLGW